MALVYLVLGGNVYLNAVQRVHDFNDLFEVYGDIVLDVRAEVFVDRADGKARAAAEVGRVQLVLADAVDFNERVAHQARELDLAPRVVDGDDHHAVGVALIIARTGIQTEQCDIRDVFVRLNAGREILICERGVVVIAEDSAVNVQSDRADRRQNDDNGQQTDENAPEAFERHNLSPFFNPVRTVQRTAR